MCALRSTCACGNDERGHGRPTRGRVKKKLHATDDALRTRATLHRRPTPETQSCIVCCVLHRRMTVGRVAACRVGYCARCLWDAVKWVSGQWVTRCVVRARVHCRARASTHAACTMRLPFIHAECLPSEEQTRP